VVCVPLALISVVLVLMPRSIGTNSLVGYDAFNLPSKDIKIPGKKKRYAVVFDAGSSGSRVHVFCFDSKTQLVKVGDDLELFKQKKPGLSNYASDPKAGAESLQSLLDEALGVVPPDQQSTTPVRLGATAGLRLLPGDQSKELLQEVDRLLERSPFKFESEWVNIIDGTQEGSYQWVTVNYLLGNLGKSFDHTVGIVDLGGGSVQMAYALSEEDAGKAPAGDKNEESYVQKIKLLGVTYNLYVHSYLNYGLYAARAEVLKLVEDGSSCPCLPKGFQGPYKYGDNTYTTLASDEGGDYDKCKSLVVKALNTDRACTHMKCTFGGIWSGGGGDGFKKLFVASFFFDRAVDAGIIKDESALTAKVKPLDFEEAARKVCAIDLEEEQKFLCLDLVYQYSLLVTGFQLDSEQELTLVKKVEYKGSAVEAAWPLGSAIELLSGRQ
jgi:apyrase